MSHGHQYRPWFSRTTDPDMVLNSSPGQVVTMVPRWLFRLPRLAWLPIAAQPLRTNMALGGGSDHRPWHGTPVMTVTTDINKGPFSHSRAIDQNLTFDHSSGPATSLDSAGHPCQPIPRCPHLSMSVSLPIPPLPLFFLPTPYSLTTVMPNHPTPGLLVES